jgi:16S rRNA (guanine527-N7)-methyltransferase
MSSIPDYLIEKTLAEYGVSVSSAIRSSVRAYISLLLRWNEKISLTTITDPLEILRFHFGESMFAALAVPVRNGRLADVGSGGGFPGLPLKIMVPSLDLVLIESNAKKASFLSECIRELNLAGVEVARCRFEDFDENALDFVTARALGDYDRLIEWARNYLTLSGKLVLWLGQDDAIKFQKNPAQKWRSPIAIPNSDRRVILVGAQN